MGLLSNFAAARAYQNQTWVPPGEFDTTTKPGFAQKKYMVPPAGAVMDHLLSFIENMGIVRILVHALHRSYWAKKLMIRHKDQLRLALSFI